MYMELTTFYYNNAPFILIGVGAAIVIVGLLGCFCTVKAYKAPLIMVSSTCISISMVIAIMSYLFMLVYSRISRLSARIGRS